MLRLAQAGIMAGVMAVPLPALACMPGGLTPTARPEKLEQCAQRWNIDEVNIIGLAIANDAGGGVVTQGAFESNGCSTANYLVVMNCATDEATFIGIEAFNVMVAPEDQPNHGALDKAEAWVFGEVKRGGPVTPEAVIGMGRGIGLDFALTVKASGKVRLSKKPLSLACGCKTYYPDL